MGCDDHLAGPTPRPRGVWAKLASLNALLDPSPVVSFRKPLEAKTNQVGQSQHTGRQEGEGEKEVEGGWWQNRAWMDRLRQELSTASKSSQKSSTTPAVHSHFIHPDAILPPGLGLSPPAKSRASADFPAQPPRLSTSRPPSRARPASAIPSRRSPDFDTAHTTSLGPTEANDADLDINSLVSSIASTEGLPPIRHSLRSGGTVEILLSLGQPVLVDLRQQSSRAILISTTSDEISVFTRLAPGPLVLVGPAAVYTRAGLPAAYEKVYRLAVTFVESVRAKTPEVSGAYSAGSPLM